MPTMGRKRLWHEAVHIKLPFAMKARIGAVLRKGEERAAFIRGAIEKEIERRRSRRGRKGVDNGVNGERIPQADGTTMPRATSKKCQKESLPDQGHIFLRSSS